MLDIATNHILLGPVAIGILLFIFSIRFVSKSDPSKLDDHFARTVASVGIAVVTIGGAFWIYNLNAQNEQRRQKETTDAAKLQERLVVAQSFRRAMFQYGIVAFQIKSTKVYCAIDSDQEIAAASKIVTFDPNQCRAAATFATRTSTLLPGVDFVFTQAAKESRHLSTSDRLAIFIMDGDTSLRSRMPAIIETNIGTYARTSRPPRNVATRFSYEMSTLQQKAEAVAAVFCIFAERVGQGWKEFDATVEKLEEVLGQEDEIELYPDIVRQLAEQTQFQKTDCTHIREELEKLFPATGGGDGGGGGGGG